jgi:hypothetical protein
MVGGGNTSTSTDGSEILLQYIENPCGCVWKTGEGHKKANDFSFVSRNPRGCTCVAEENHKEAAEFCCLEIHVAALDWPGRNTE